MTSFVPLYSLGFIEIFSITFSQGFLFPPNSINSFLFFRDCCSLNEFVVLLSDIFFILASLNVFIYATDFSKHESVTNHIISTGEDYDFLADNYEMPPSDIDWIIMNPPFKTIEPFLIRSLEIAEKGVVMFARLQFLEGQHRYDSILKENPFTDMYVYVDRIQCWKDGVKPEGSSAQAYAWFIWNKEKENDEPIIHWIRRAE